MASFFMVFSFSMIHSWYMGRQCLLGTSSSREYRWSEIEMSFKTENARAKAEEIKQLKDLFSLYDNDNSGSINKTELKLLMNSLGYYPSDEMIQQMILENDVDGDELIDFEEFVQMAQKYKKEEAMSPQNALRNALQ